MLGNRAHRHAQKLVAVLVVEDRHRFEAEFLERQVRDLGGLAPPANRDALAGGRALLQRDAQVLAHLGEQVQRIVHELVREARLLGDAARSDQVGDAVRLHVDALDVALADQALQVDVGQPEGDAELGREVALGDARIVFHGLEQLEVAVSFNIHNRSIHGLLSVACEGNDSGVGEAGRRPRDRLPPSHSHPGAGYGAEWGAAGLRVHVLNGRIMTKPVRAVKVYTGVHILNDRPFRM